MGRHFCQTSAMDAAGSTAAPLVHHSSNLGWKAVRAETTPAATSPTCQEPSRRRNPESFQHGILMMIFLQISLGHRSQHLYGIVPELPSPRTSTFSSPEGTFGESRVLCKTLQLNRYQFISLLSAHATPSGHNPGIPVLDEVAQLHLPVTRWKTLGR